MPQTQWTVTRHPQTPTIHIHEDAPGHAGIRWRLDMPAKPAPSSVRLASEMAKVLALRNDPHMDLVVEQTSVRRIPVLILRPSTAGPLPTVILIHGYTGEKATTLREGFALAQAGFVTILPDARMHGDRRPSDFARRFAAPHFLEAFFAVVRDTAYDVSILLDAIERFPFVDEQALGLAGISMGGFTSFLAAALDTRLKAVAPLIASPDWFSLRTQADAPQEPGDELRAQLRQWNPLERAADFLPTALLVQNTAQDSLVPPAGSRKLARDLRKRYQEAGIPERFQYIEYPDEDHVVTETMLQRTIQWFQQYLKRPE